MPQARRSVCFLQKCNTNISQKIEEYYRENIGKSDPKIIDKSVESSYYLIHTTG